MLGIVGDHFRNNLFPGEEIKGWERSGKIRNNKTAEYFSNRSFFNKHQRKNEFYMGRGPPFIHQNVKTNCHNLKASIVFHETKDTNLIQWKVSNYNKFSKEINYKFSKEIN